MKVERVSYDVITPSSARSIFEAISWKPAITWRITKIEVLKPIKWISIRRNEVGAVIPTKSIEKALKGSTSTVPSLFAEEERQQRAGLLLKDVAYRLHAHFVLTDRAGPGDTTQKFAEIFRRRASKGQCFNQPYLGCREFSCCFQLVNSDEALIPAIPESRELGWMLYDMDFSNPKGAAPLFFNARMNNGIINIPPRDSEEVKG